MQPAREIEDFVGYIFRKKGILKKSSFIVDMFSHQPRSDIKNYCKFHRARKSSVCSIDTCKIQYAVCLFAITNFIKSI